MGDFLQLRINRLIKIRMAVSMHVTPNAANRIDVLFAINIIEIHAVCTLDDERLIFRHLRKRVPDSTLVDLVQLIR